MAQESGHGDATAPPGEDAADSAVRLLEVVRDLTTELRPRQGDAEAVSLDSTLDRDLGLDSLARVELLTRLENAFDATLPEAVFVNSETPRDLLRALLGAKGARRPDANFEAREMALGGAEAVPRSAATLVEVLTWHAVAHPERPHVRLYSDDGEGEVITYGALKEGAEQIAAGLLRLGFEPGEAVVIMLPTGRDYFLTFFGALLAGGVPVPIYPPARAAHIEEHLRRHAAIVANCRGAVMVTVAEARPVACLLRSQVETLRHVVTPDELQEAPGGLAMPVVGAGDTAFLQYTSGSTGDPKGVVLSHANLLANIRVMGEVLEVGPDDVFVSWLPLYHDMGLIGAWLGSLHFAVPLVIMSPLAFLARPQRWLWAIHRYRGTLSAAPNFAYELCLRRIADADIEGLDLSSWRMAANGAEAVSPETVERFGARFKAHGFRRTALMPMYGLAENSVGLAFTPLGRGPLIDRVERRALSELGHAIPASASDEAAQAIVACGRPLPGHQVRIVDAGGRELAERRQGRLQFMGPSSTSGYFRNADATRALFQGEWLDSGDLAYVAEGDVYITGRAKDVIIKAGRNIYPAEFEEAIGELPGIRAGNVAVFGSIDASAGTERLVVLAETRKRDEAGRAELMVRINAVATDLAGMPPDDIVLAPPNTVLKTSSGKIRRAACREIFEQGLIGKPGRSLRWQVARLALSGVLPWLRRTWRGFGALAFAAYGWMVFLTLTLPTWLLVAGLPREPWALGGHPRRPQDPRRRHGDAPRRRRARQPAAAGHALRICFEPCQLSRRLRHDGGVARPIQLRRQGGADGELRAPYLSRAHRHQVRRALRPATGHRRRQAHRRRRPRRPPAPLFRRGHVHAHAGPPAVPHGGVHGGGRGRSAGRADHHSRHALHVARRFGLSQAGRHQRGHRPTNGARSARWGEGRCLGRRHQAAQRDAAAHPGSLGRARPGIRAPAVVICPAW